MVCPTFRSEIIQIDGGVPTTCARPRSAPRLPDHAFGSCGAGRDFEAKRPPYAGSASWRCGPLDPYCCLLRKCKEEGDCPSAKDRQVRRRMAARADTRRVRGGAQEG